MVSADFAYPDQAEGGADGGGAIAAVFKLKRIVNIRKRNVAPITIEMERIP
jgi:hypothetical protein